MALLITSLDKRDIYYRKAKDEGWRARSAYKLLQIEEKFGILKGVTRVVDLCAAPGGWSQVLVKMLGPVKGGGDAKSFAEPKTSIKKRQATIVAVDLMKMAPINGVKMVIGDITRQSTAEKIIEKFEKGARAQLVLCDGAPDVVGLPDVDEFVQHELVLAALNISTCLLEPGGGFVSKVFRGRDVGRLMRFLKQFFGRVEMSKPYACRNSSMEGFVVCRDYKPPTGFTPSLARRLTLPVGGGSPGDSFGFVACGAKDAWDADRSYALDKPSERPSQPKKFKPNADDQKTAIEMLRPAAAAKASAHLAHAARVRKSAGYRAPDAPPIDPPYKAALAWKQANAGNKTTSNSDTKR